MAMTVCFFCWLVIAIERGRAGASPAPRREGSAPGGAGWGIARRAVPTGRGDHLCHVFAGLP